ncbi:hypothetical protein CBR_g231 [Chara braunii]|uniref:Tubulin/FtsZ GTPase domain-containing protein n=1 Tax=Chara braunii TaxID=69332 RepID=A0A388JM37_CHABU|nr:hypothetical protein CBR_g231 [Chara braunii]|eukprot:GBG58831.1 hypothetical protein CBR_g231 [Chara braunii]
MPREIITIQVGQCGNQIGCRFWELALKEHSCYNPRGLFDDALSSFFHNVDRRFDPPLELPVGDGRGMIRFLKARAVLIDMEEGVVKELLKGSLGELFDSRQYITDMSGSGNNWAHGHEVYGPQYKDSILESVRREAEGCDSLQSFFMLHSLGGGTGSGVGTYVMEQLHDEYPEVYRFSACVFPSADDDVVTSPYNSMLAVASLAENTDCVLPIENQALIEITRNYSSSSSSSSSSRTSRGGLNPSCLAAAAAAGGRRGTGRQGERGGGGCAQRTGHSPSAMATGRGVYAAGSSSLPSSLHENRCSHVDGNHGHTSQRQMAGGKPWDDMNGVAASLLLDLTCSVRFEGSLNVDMNEITMNLVPYPRLHFLVSSMSPLLGGQAPPSPSLPASAGAFAAAGRTQPSFSSSSSSSANSKAIDILFSEVFSWKNQLIKADPCSSTYLACALTLRGSPTSCTISDMNRNIARIKNRLNMVYWNAPEGFKVGLCSKPPVGLPYSLLCLCNNCCVSDTFTNIKDRFSKLFKRGMFLHHYTKYMEPASFEDSLETLETLIADYQSLQWAQPPPTVPRLHPIISTFK